ncbi:MAG: alpha/beta fold hydrolase [Nitrososphaerota archaeon]|nr:alpha/beta fold hydrolase [Nitrososphaerota archaeon]
MTSSKFVLIHGAWHGAWCWDKVIPILKRKHEVIAIDLPGHGRNRSVPVTAITLETYTSSVVRTLDSLNDPVILVGHSMGGIVITQSAEYRPKKIRKLVYLTAFLPRNGECLLDHANLDSKALVMPNAILDKQTNSISFNRGVVKEIFYQDCSHEDAERAESLLVPQAIAPFNTKVATSQKNFGSISRVYIECLKDRAITLETQRKMYMAQPCEKVISIDSGHSPFFSSAEELAENLESIAQDV